MKNATTVTNLNIRKNAKGDFYTAYQGRNSLAKNLEFYGGVWKITFNNESVDYYESPTGEIVYVLTSFGSDTKNGLYFETAEQELLFLEQFANCEKAAQKMIELIRIIKES